MKRLNYILEKINYPIFAVCLVILIGSLTLFIKPIVGMANNGDYSRIMVSNNLYYLDSNGKQETHYFKYFQPTYGIDNYYNDAKKMIVSTQSLLIKPAIKLDELVTRNDKIFDLRFLAVILLFIQCIATYLIIKVLTESVDSYKYKMILTLLYIFIFMDTGYIAYFNSLFGEGVMIPFFLLSCGILMYILKFNKVRWYTLGAFLIVTFIFIGSKQQLAPIGILVAILLSRFIYYYKSKSIKIVSILGILFMIGSGIYFYTQIKGDFQYINRYHSLNRGILLYENDPDKILDSMGINNQYSLLENTIYFGNVTQVDLKDKELINNYYKHFGVLGILKYYMLHPSDAYKMLKIGFNDAYDIRPQELGNYTIESLKPPVSRSHFFSLWSYFKLKILPKGIVPSIIYIVIFFIPLYKRYKKNLKEGNKVGRLTDEVYIYIFLMGLSQIIISFIGAGDADLAKHEFLYNLSWDMLFIIFVMNLLKNREMEKGDK